MLDSLYFRLNSAAMMVLAIFLIATGSVLDNAFVESTRLSLRERMLGQMYQLLSVSDIDTATGQLTMPLPINLPYAQLALPDSGTYAYICRNDEPTPSWRSPSLNNRKLPRTLSLQPGEKRWLEVKMDDGKDYYLLGFGLQRTVDPGIYSYNFHLAHELAPLHQQIYLYRCRLWGGLAATAILLLATQIFLLRWGLAPLRKVSQELNAIKAGTSRQLNGHYPREIRKLTDNINNLLTKEHNRQTRYRNALADLAHSLKTPLAVLSGAAKETDKLPAIVSEQTNRMWRIVERQLQRAGAAGSAVSLPPVSVYSVAERIIPSLSKVYASKAVALRNLIDPTLALLCDEADLIEMLGNLLDNAFKWCNGKIELIGYKGMQGQLVFRVDDDGPGIHAEDIDHILQRGGRIDELMPGHGIGLAVTSDIADIYQGQLHIEVSPLGGAAIILSFIE